MEDVYVKVDGYGSYFEEDKDLFTIDEILRRLEELYLDKEHLEEELRDLRQDIEDNYKPVSYAEQIGYNERDYC